LAVCDAVVVFSFACLAALAGCSGQPARSGPADASATASVDGAAAGRREEAWVSNSGETTISVIDHGSRTVVGTIQLGVAADGGPLRGIPHGIAVARTGDVAYSGTEDTGEVVAIDTKRRVILWRLQRCVTGPRSD
jgi:DNA-binding beta-propeller fold protein YncE